MDKHKFLIVVDMQNDFVSGSLGSKEAQDVADRIMEKLESFEQKENIYFTKDCHNDSYLKSHEGIKLPVEHCIYGTDGCEFIDHIKEFIWNNNLEDHIFDKQYFASPSLPYAIYEEIYDKISIYENSDSLTTELLNNIEIEFIGLCTDICVISNIFAIKHMLECEDFDSVRLICNSKYCAGSTPERHEAALEVMRACLIDVI